MTVTNATNFRNHLFEYLNQAVEFGDIITVSTKKGEAVVMNIEDYNGLRETLYLNQFSGTVNDVIQAKENENNPDFWIKKENFWDEEEGKKACTK